MTNYTEKQSPVESEPLTNSSSGFVKKYIGAISLITIILIIVIFWGFYTRHTNLLKEQMVHESRAFFQEIVQTRQWIIDQEGVYVKKKQGMRVDPILDEIEGLKTSIKDESGQTYLLRSHAAITKMISAIATEERLFGINITSLNPLSQHEPDNFERASLNGFEEGSKENYTFEKTPRGVLFRYMAPLLTEEECLKCHGSQGSGVGDIRGGISISIPANHILKEIYETRVYILISAFALLTLLLSVKVYIARRFITALDKSEQKLIELATTDPLTGLLNRREGIRKFKRNISHSIRKKLPLSVIIIDIDFFKQINDKFGHQNGDDAIRIFADILNATLRDYDIICRYGGEEYLVILPTTDMSMALEIAERIRKVLADESVMTRTGNEIRMTVSSGVSSLQPTDTLESLLYRADNALYIAKEEGRDQVQFL